MKTVAVHSAWLALVALSILAGCVTVPRESTMPPSAGPMATSAPVSTSPIDTPSPIEHVMGQAYSTNGVEAFVYGEPLGSLTGKLDSKNKGLSREGWRVDLMGVYRLAEDRVLVEARLNADNAKVGILDALADPNYDMKMHQFDPKRGSYTGTVEEFSDVRLTVAGDDTEYLPVRTKSNFCLCTMKGEALGGSGDLPAYVVMAMPKNATQVTLSIPYVGSFDNISVADSIPQRDLVPLTGGAQMRLLSLKRSAPGEVTARLALELTTDGVAVLTVLDGQSPWETTASILRTQGKFKNVFALTPDGVWGGWEADPDCASCTKGPTLMRSQGVDVEVTVPDPGTVELVFGGTAGWLFSARNVPGAASKASNYVYQYFPQQKSTGLQVGEKIDLDTSVLFATDKATLTPAAGKVLDKSVKILQAQDGRRLSIVGHTDSTGTSSHNKDLSMRRAQAVKDALASRLGPGWSFTVKGVGETDPRIKESGLSGADLDRARALNRRVEISVAK